MSAGQWGSTRATKWETHVFRAALGRIVACAPAISRVSFSFSDRRRTPQSERAAAAVATGSAASSEHGGVSRSGHAGWHRCVRRIGRGHGAAGASRGVPPKKSSPRRLGTTHESALSLSDASSLTSDREARSVGRAYTTNETPRDTHRGARRLDAFDSTERGRPLTVSSPPKNSPETKKTAPAHVEELRAGRPAAPFKPRGVVPRVDRGRPDVRPDDRRAVRSRASAREALRD